MKCYKIVIKDSFFKKEFTGMFHAPNKKWAIQEAKRWYAQELGSMMDEMTVLSISII